MKRRGHSGPGKARDIPEKAPQISDLPGKTRRQRLDIVLKSDSMGSCEAVISSLEGMKMPGVELNIISSGVGSVSKSDLLMAVTGSRLVLGFSTDAMPKIEEECRERGIEVRLYDVIYKLLQDVGQIAGSLIAREAEEKITGRGRVVALFKSTRKGIILGCKVLEGVLGVGNSFRVISPMGVMYTGKIESLHIEKEEVNAAKAGQEVGLKISDFKKAKVGDQVECFETPRTKVEKPWQPRAGVFRI